MKLPEEFKFIQISRPDNIREAKCAGDYYIISGKDTNDEYRTFTMSINDILNYLHSGWIVMQEEPNEEVI